MCRAELPFLMNSFHLFMRDWEAFLLLVRLPRFGFRNKLVCHLSFGSSQCSFCAPAFVKLLLWLLFGSWGRRMPFMQCFHSVDSVTTLREKRSHSYKDAEICLRLHREMVSQGADVDKLTHHTVGQLGSPTVSHKSISNN